MEQTLNGLAELAELKEGTNSAAFTKAALAYDFADAVRAVECLQQANRELAEENLKLGYRMAEPPRWLHPGTLAVGGPSSLDYADEVTGPVTGAVLPAVGVSRLQVYEAAAKVACCGLTEEAVLLRLLLDEVEQLQQESETGKEAASA